MSDEYIDMFFNDPLDPEEKQAIEDERLFRMLAIREFKSLRVDVKVLKDHDVRDYAAIQVLKTQVRTTAAIISLVVGGIISFCVSMVSSWAGQ